MGILTRGAGGALCSGLGMPKHNVLLVPGFFGFSAFGKLTYFHGIKTALERSFEKFGLSVEVTEVTTLPTASIRVRAAKVQEALAAIVARNDGPIHIVGHSTGGLDARLAIAPTASLPTRVKFEAFDRVRTVVTVCTCHFGSPLATFFSSGSGRWLLRLLCRYLMWVLRRGRWMLTLALRAGHVALRLRHPLGKRLTTFDELYAKLFDAFSNETRAELIQFFDAVSKDESLVFQLTPPGCDLLNACTADPNVRYGSVVARARRPNARGFFRSFSDAYAQVVYPAYAFMYRLAARHEARWIPEAVGQQRERLLRGFGELPSPSDNDGIVPTNSQIWGEIVHVTTADHLDVVGHYGTYDAPEHAGDWIPSQSGFGADEFEALWSDVAAFIVSEARAEGRAGSAPAIGTERTEHDLPDSTPNKNP